MAGLIPIPTTRITGLFARQRLTQQLQNDQLGLFRLQDQISTGQRIILPSDDAPAALRSIALQRLIERKAQFESNIATGNDFLAATDRALASVADKLIEIKGATLDVVDTTTTQEQRNAAIAEIDGFLQSLVGIGNTQFRGRFLFAGTQTSQQPFSFEDDNVVYHGDNGSVRNHSDIGVLFSTNSPGDSVFGGISAEVQGTVDLNPQLNSNTLLKTLRGGRGIEPNGALSISDGTNSSIIDISGAVTVGDVVRLIEENPVGSRQITVSISGQGLNLQFDPSVPANSGANLIVQEVGNGTSAKELGIVTSAGLGTSLLAGDDLDPTIQKTTSLGDLLGTKARAKLTGGGSNNDILLEASANGTAFDGVTVQFVDDELLQAAPGLTAGNEVAEYDANARASRASLSFLGNGNDLIITADTPGAAFNNVAINVVTGAVDIGDAATANYDSGTKTLTITVDDTGETSINSVINAVATTGQFTATHDNSVEAALNPAALITGGVSGNTGNSGGDAKTLYIRIDPGASKANNVVAAVNTEGTFTAKLDAVDSSSSLEAGTGLVNFSSTATTTGGSGVMLDKSSGIRVVNGGETFDITFGNAENVNDLLNALNGSDAGLFAEINADGSGINIRSRLSGHDFQIGENGGQTATQLGIRSYTNSTKLQDFNYGVGIEAQEGFNLPTTAGTDITITKSDGTSIDVDLSGAKSLNDVVVAINGAVAASAAPGSVTAQLGAPGNVLELVDNTFPGIQQFTLSQASGSLAAQYLGIVPNNQTSVVTPTDTLTGDSANYVDFTIQASDGSTFGADLSQAKTVEDVINAINSVTGAAVTAQLASAGNGINLVDNTGGAGQLTVTQAEGSQAAVLLGFVPDDPESAQPSASSATGSLQSTDQHFLETDSVFTTLIRLRDALVANDLSAISRAAAKIEEGIDRVTFARAEVGARQQGLEVSQRSLEDEEIQLRSALSDQLDVDLIEAISSLTARQVSLEASLRATANILQLSLLNFI